MTFNRTVYIKCWQGSRLLRTYDFLVGGSQASPPIIEPDTLKAEARSNLTTEHLAFPPYDGIRFEIANAP